MATNAHSVPPPVTLLSAAVPGRRRVRVEGLRRSPSLATWIVERLVALDPVASARANPITGSVLVIFDVTRVTANQLIVEIVRCRAVAVMSTADSNGAAPPTPAKRSEARPHRQSSASASKQLGRSPGLQDGPRRTSWHAMEASAVATHLHVLPARGLSPAEAAERLAVHGPNSLPNPEPKSAIAILVDQVATLPVALLAGAAAVSVVSGAIFDALVIAGVVVVNAVVGYVTESRVERILTSLQRMAIPTAMVQRDGQASLIPAAALVPGDVIVLRAGHEVPADGRLLDGTDLLINESLLTGESMPVSKRAGAVHPDAIPVADRTNLVFAGTVVSEGDGLAVVTDTGRHSEVGQIRALIAETDAPSTPLEEHLGQMGRTLVGVTVGLCGVAFGLGMLRGVSFLEMARTAIALGVAAVPEGLPAVATTTLALGMHRMLQRQALVRRLEVIESLGATTVVCVDKTGTLTENRMSVRGWALEHGDFVADDGAGPEPTRRRRSALKEMDPRLTRAITIAVLCNEAELVEGDDKRAIRGSPTEGALLEAARRHGIDYREVRNAFALAEVWPRAEGQNWMATRHRGADGAELIAVKGAPEEVLQRSTMLMGTNGHARRLTPKLRREILTANARMADQAMRVLGLAYKETGDSGHPPGSPNSARPGEPATLLESHASSEEMGDSGQHAVPLDGHLTWVGLVGMADPI